MEKLPAQMTVIGISKPGGPEVLLPETRSVPTPGPGEILVKVLAAGVNRPDVAQRSGAYPPPPGASDLPGLEELKGTGLLDSRLPSGFGVPTPSDDPALRDDEDPLEIGDLELALAPAVEPESGEGG